MEDGVDYVPAKTPILLGHHFSSIAGAGPINGPIQAALFGWVPVFLWIVIGGIFFGAVQDFGSIFVSIRHQGKSLGEVIEENIGHRCKVLFTVFAWLVLLLVIAAFADIVAASFTCGEGVTGIFPGAVEGTANGSVAMASILSFRWQLFRRPGLQKNAPLIVSTIVGVVLLAICIGIGLVCPINLPKSFWIGFVFIYICIASVTPVWILLQPRDYLNSFLLYFMMVAAIVGIIGAHPTIVTPAYVGFKVGSSYLFPVLFITVACGILSGFHSTQTAIISRTMKSERQGRMTFYNMMILEGFIAMIWAAAAMGVYNLGLQEVNASLATGTVGIICRDLLGPVGGIIALLGVIVLPITSGDTALRSLRLSISDSLHIDQSSKPKRLGLSAIIFALVAVILVFAKSSPDGFNLLWRYFAWSNQTLSLFAFLGISVWMFENSKAKWVWIPLIPGAWYTFVTVTFIANAQIGFHIPWTPAYIIGVCAAVAYVAIIVWYGKKRAARLQKL